MSDFIPSNRKISIIVCCYNGEDTIEACLKGLVNQKRDNISIEVILVDDGSKDKTADKIAKFLEQNIGFENLEFKYFRKINEGLSIARNYGLIKSNAKFVAYIDEDAVPYNDFALNLINTFDNNPEVNCIGGQVELFNDDLSFPLLIQHTFFSSYMKHPFAIIGTNMAYRKDFLLEVGGFQPEFTYRGDESALFQREREKIEILKVEHVRVKHNQPATLKAYLNNRYENGYFRAAIDYLTNQPFMVIGRKVIIAILMLFFPVVLFLSFFILNRSDVSFVMLGLYSFILLRRFVFNGLFSDLFGEYNKNKDKHKSKHSILFLCFVIVYGVFKTDFGYLKGCLKYSNQIWKDSKQELEKLATQKTVPVGN